mgnify:FL=1
MGRRKKHNAKRGVPLVTGEPLRWRITEWNRKLSIVLLDMAPPLSPGEVIIWEGAAPHMAEAYRRARNSGLPICLTKDGFKLRMPKNG